MGNYFKGPITPGAPILFGAPVSFGGSSTSSGSDKKSKNDDDKITGLSAQQSYVRKQENDIELLRSQWFNRSQKLKNQGMDNDAILSDPELQNLAVDIRKMRTINDQNKDLSKQYLGRYDEWYKDVGNKEAESSFVVDERGNRKYYSGTTGKVITESEMKENDFKEYYNGNGRFITNSDYSQIIDQTFVNDDPRNPKVTMPDLYSPVDVKAKHFNEEMYKRLNEAKSQNSQQLASNPSLQSAGNMFLRSFNGSKADNYYQLSQAARNLYTGLSEEAKKDAKQQFWKEGGDFMVAVQVGNDNKNDIRSPYAIIPIKEYEQIKNSEPTNEREKLIKNGTLKKEDTFYYWVADKAFSAAQPLMDNDAQGSYSFYKMAGADYKAGEGAVEKMKTASLAFDLSRYNFGNNQSIISRTANPDKSNTEVINLNERTVFEIGEQDMGEPYKKTLLEYLNPNALKYYDAGGQEFSKELLEKGTRVSDLTSNIIVKNTGDVLSFKNGVGKSNQANVQKFFKDATIIDVAQKTYSMPIPKRDKAGNFTNGITTSDVPAVYKLDSSGNKIVDAVQTRAQGRTVYMTETQKSQYGVYNLYTAIVPESNLDDYEYVFSSKDVLPINKDGKTYYKSSNDAESSGAFTDGYMENTDQGTWVHDKNYKVIQFYALANPLTHFYGDGEYDDAPTTATANIYYAGNQALLKANEKYNKAQREQ